MYLTPSSPTVLRFFASIKDGRGLKPSARDAGIDKEVGYRWLREKYLKSRRDATLRERYGVEVLETGADPAVVRATLVDRDAQGAERDERQAQARDDQDLAAGLVVGTEVLEVSAELADAEEAQALRDLAAVVDHDAELSWDSAERREMHVEGIKAGPDQAAAAAAWKQADVDQARHPREALQGGRKGELPRIRVPAATQDRQISRDGR